MQIRLRTNRNYREIGLLRQSQSSLTNRFINQYGVGSTSDSQSIPQPQQDGNEDQELNEDGLNDEGLNDEEILEDDQDDEELQDDDAGNDDVPNE